MTLTTGGDYLDWLGSPAEDWQTTAAPLRGHGQNPGVTVLIPTYTSAEGERTATLRHCLDSVLSAARPDHVPVAFVVVDNGLSPGAARQTGEMLRRSGCAHRIVEAVSTPSGRYTAAEARNAGLAMLAELPDTSELRRQYLLFLDDDTALGQHALARLMAALRAEERAIAACPTVMPVSDLAAWRAAHERRRQSAEETSGAPVRRLPGPLTAHGYDLLSVTAYGSLITGRAVGLLVRQAPVMWWIRCHGPVFYTGTPHGSCEDILAMATLSRLGQLWSVPAATVADEARKSPGATRRQQFSWGYDHAWLARRLAEAGLLGEGVHGLSWTAPSSEATAHWEFGQADWGGPVGFLINPDELRFGYRLLDAISSAPAVGTELFGEFAGAVTVGTQQLGRVLDRWDRSRSAVRRQPRPGLPSLGDRDWSSLRDGLDALIGHLAGNVAGSCGNDLDWAAIPAFFLYGARQPAADRAGHALAGAPVTAPAPVTLDVAS